MLWIAGLTATTYTLAGHMREQVCTYMCPWPRIQAALTDEYALNVTYRFDRGEPRASVKKSEQLRLEGLPAGDCIDCRQCVNVCPTGIDIRNGSQLECIQCGLCIDACDNIMEKIGRPTRLIGYDSEVNLERRIAGEPPVQKIVRTRTVFYAAIIAAVGGIMLYALLTRHAFDVSVIHDRNPVFVRMADGAIRNGYTMRILNKQLETRRFALSVDGIAGAVVEIVGLAAGFGAMWSRSGPTSRANSACWSAITNLRRPPPRRSSSISRISNRAYGRRRMIISAHRSEQDERESRLRRGIAK